MQLVLNFSKVFAIVAIIKESICFYCGALKNADIGNLIFLVFLLFLRDIVLKIDLVNIAIKEWE